MRRTLLAGTIAAALAACISEPALAGPCYATDLNSISQEDFFFKGEFGRIGLLRPNNKIAELTRYTCYDLQPLRKAGSMKVVINPFVSSDPVGLLIEKPLYVGLQVVSIHPNAGRSRVEFQRSKNSKAHAGMWAVPKGKWQSAYEIKGRATGDDVEVASHDSHFSSTPDIPERPPAIGFTGRRIPEAVQKFQSTTDPDEFQAMSGRWHAWIVSSTQNGDRDEYEVHSDTWEDSAEWRLSQNEIDRLVAGNKVTIRNYLHLLTPMQVPDSESDQVALVGNRAPRNSAELKRRMRQVIFDVPVSEAACVYMRPIASADVKGRIPLQLVNNERFVSFTRSSEYNCPGPDEYQNLWSYLWNVRVLGRR